ncbi:MAG: ferredoxin [Thermomicrobiales bacterium]|nr:ferredoxin [Thermomicrobiales bacterium]MEA2524342.1 ferredoxin [Thermomicrobiales bacterium]MEA2529523.1 ferredoxin [Thermomicrobiales bacterium]MEA2583789.1 ferredoxin [Thermomicrobiales bacterium]MEA2595764.1 ferredoxin [Thermomicrobiales bacterium]
MTGAAVRVTLTDGESFEVEPGETVLGAALRAGVVIPYSCQSGTCRTCFSRVVSGRIEHDPDYADDLLIDEDEVAAGYRLLCSSLAHTDSVIEIGG